jgi:hypothetical protein
MVELRLDPEVASLVDGTNDARVDSRSVRADDCEVAGTQACARFARRPLRCEWISFQITKESCPNFSAGF